MPQISRERRDHADHEHENPGSIAFDALLFGSAQIWLGRRRVQHFAKQSELLQRFHTPALSEWLVQHPDFLSEPVRQDAAIVFIDLSGFTGLSETLGPSAIRELLKVFYGLVEEEVEARSGVIMRFTGDGAMIVFGLLEPSTDDASRAQNEAAWPMVLQQQETKLAQDRPVPEISRLHSAG